MASASTAGALVDRQVGSPDLHGPDRKSFMRQCLSGKGKPAAAS